MTIVVDASVLFEVVADTHKAEPARALMARADELAAPHLVDAEVLAVVQTQLRRGNLDETAAVQAIDDLRIWPGVRWPHRPLLHRAWALRHNVRGYDALYVALAEALEAPLLTLDTRLSSSAGVGCPVVLPREPSAPFSDQ